MSTATAPVAGSPLLGSTAVTAPTAVLVLGPPRSGTSAVSHMLQRLGVYFGAPDDFVDPEVHSHNPIFFELKKLNELNERILAEIGIEYAEFDYFHDPAEIAQKVGTSFVSDIQSLVAEELAGCRLIGLKDPRFVLTLPVWVAALEGLGYSIKYVLTRRSLDAVVRSNMAVNGFSESHNRRIAVLSEQMAAAQLIGKQALVVDYDRLVEEPLAQSQRVAAWLGPSAVNVAAAANVITGDLRHHAATERVPVAGDASRDYIAAQASEFIRLQAALNDIGIIDLVDGRRGSLSNCSKEVHHLVSLAHDLEQRLLLANTEKAVEGAAYNREIEELRARLHHAEQDALGANTAKAVEGAEYLRKIGELRERLHHTEQDALSANTAKAIEGAEYLRLIGDLRDRLHHAEQDALAANTAKAAEGSDYLRTIDELCDRLRQVENEVLVANTEKADQGRRFAAESDELRAALDVAADRELAMGMRIHGLERRQRWAIAAAACAAIAAAAFLMWQ